MALTETLRSADTTAPRRVLTSFSHLLQSGDQLLIRKGFSVDCSLPLKAQRLAVIGLALGLLFVSGCVSVRRYERDTEIAYHRGLREMAARLSNPDIDADDLRWLAVSWKRAEDQWALWNDRGCE